MSQRLVGLAVSNVITINSCPIAGKLTLFAGRVANSSQIYT
jgi:hypothetical protein